MKAIIQKDKMPKMLKFGKQVEKISRNKYLLEPYRTGEIVKVHENQEPTANINSELFKRHFVRIIRKNPSSGEWNLNYVVEWDHMELLTTKQ